MAKYTGTRPLIEINIEGLNNETLDLVQEQGFSASFKWLDFLKPDTVRWNFNIDISSAEEQMLYDLLAAHDRTEQDNLQAVAEQFPQGASEGMYYNASTSGLESVTVQGALDELDYIVADVNSNANTREASFTGVITGGVMTITSPNTVTVTAGYGKLTDSWTNPDESNETIISWLETIITFTTQELTDQLTWRILVDINGNIVKNSTALSPSNYRTHLVLGSIYTDLEGALVNIINSKIIHNNTLGLLIDEAFSESFFKVLNGKFLVPSINGTDKQFKLTEGEVFIPGIEFESTPTNPNRTNTSAIDPVNIIYIDSISTSYYKQPNEELDGTKYEPDFEGSLSSVPNGRYTNQKVYLSGASILVIQYGPTYYIEMNDAIKGLSQDAISWVNTPLTNGMQHIGWISVLENYTNISDSNEVKFIRVGGTGAIGTPDVFIEADDVIYDNINSGLTALNVQDAIDELDNSTKDAYITLTETTTSESGKFYILNAASNSLELHLNIPTDGDRNRYVLEDITNTITIIADGNIPIDGSTDPIVYSSINSVNRLYEIIYVKTINEWKLYQLGAFNRTPVEEVLVSINGDDNTTFPNMFAPFRTIKAAVEYSKTIASSENPVKINILPGVFVEDNPIIVDNGFINIVGSGSSTTLVLPKNIDEAILSLSSSEPFGGSDIINIGFYGSISDFDIELKNVSHILYDKSYSLPYRSSRSFDKNILSQLATIQDTFALNNTSGTSGTNGIRIKNIAAINLENIGSYNISNCDFVSFEKSININTDILLDKIYTFINNVYFENNDICIQTNGANMNIQIDGIQAYNNPIVLNADNQSFISMSNFTIDNFDIFQDTQEIAVINALNSSLVLLKTGYVFNVGIIALARFIGSILGDVIDAQNVNIGYICDEGSEFNIPNTSITNKNITVFIPNTGNNSHVIINNLNSQTTLITEFRILSFNSTVTVASATLDISKIINVDVINWSNLNVTFNTPVSGNFFFNDVFIGNSLNGSKIAVGNGGPDFRNTIILMGPSESNGTNGTNDLQLVNSVEPFVYDTTIVDNSLYFTNNTYLNNLPILWHGFVINTASAIDHTDGGELIFEIYNGTETKWTALANMVTNGNSPYSSVGKNNFFTFLQENIRINNYARDYWDRADAEIFDDNLEHYWARIRVVSPFTTAVTINKLGIVLNSTAIREDGYIEYFGTARTFTSISGFDVNTLQITPTGDVGSGIGFWADQSFYITRTLNTMNNNVSTTFNYIINFPLNLDTSSPLILALKMFTDDDQGGDFNFKIRMGLVQDESVVYTIRANAPVSNSRIVENDNVYIAPTTANIVQTYFIPIDVSDFMPVKHSINDDATKLEVTGVDTSLGVNITRDGSVDTHQGNISIVNIEHHYISFSNGQSSAQYVDVTKNIGKSYNLLFVTKDINDLDSTEKDVINIMQSKSIIPTLLDDDNVTNTSWIDYDLIYISATVDANKIGTKFNNSPIGILINNVEVLVNMNLVLLNEINSKSNIRNIIISDNSHYITLPYNISDSLSITKLRRIYSYITTINPDNRVLATLDTNFTEGNLLQWNDTDLDLNSNELPSRRVFFGYGEDAALADDGINLISRSLDWLIYFDVR